MCQGGKGGEDRRRARPGPSLRRRRRSPSLGLPTSTPFLAAMPAVLAFVDVGDDHRDNNSCGPAHTEVRGPALVVRVNTRDFGRAMCFSGFAFSVCVGEWGRLAYRRPGNAPLCRHGCDLGKPADSQTRLAVLSFPLPMLYPVDRLVCLEERVESTAIQRVYFITCVFLFFTLQKAAHLMSAGQRARVKHTRYLLRGAET